MFAVCSSAFPDTSPHKIFTMDESGKLIGIIGDEVSGRDKAVDKFIVALG